MAVSSLADFGRSTSLPQAQGSLPSAASAADSLLEHDAARLPAAPPARAHSTALISQYSERPLSYTERQQMEPLWDKPDAGPSPSNHELQPEDICNLQELPELGVTSATTRSIAPSPVQMRDARNLQADFARTHNAQEAGKGPVPAPPPLQMRDSEVARNLQADLDVEAAAEARIPETWSEVVDPKGRTYYWNKTTQETSWTTPPGWNNSVQTQLNVDVSRVQEIYHQQAARPLAAGAL